MCSLMDLTSTALQLDSMKGGKWFYYLFISLTIEFCTDNRVLYIAYDQFHSGGVSP